MLGTSMWKAAWSEGCQQPHPLHRTPAGLLAASRVAKLCFNPAQQHWVRLLHITCSHPPPTVHNIQGSSRSVSSRSEILPNTPLKYHGCYHAFISMLKEILCVAFIFKIAAFKTFSRGKVRFILSKKCLSFKPYLPNHLFLLTKYNQPSK